MFFRKQLLLYIIFLTPLSSYAATNYVSILEGGVDFTNASIQDIASVLMIMVISAAALLTALMIIVGGFKYVGSDVVTDKGDGKKMILNALLGLGIILIAVPLLRTINPKLLQLSALPTINYSINDRPRGVTVGTISSPNERKAILQACPNQIKTVSAPGATEESYCCTNPAVQEYYCGDNTQPAKHNTRTVNGTEIDLTKLYTLQERLALQRNLGNVTGTQIIGFSFTGLTPGIIESNEQICKNTSNATGVETEVIYINTVQKGGAYSNNFNKFALCIPKQ